MRHVDVVTLVVDGRQHGLGGRLSSRTEGLDGIQAFMERHAHVAAERGETVEDWRPYAPPQDGASPRP